MKHIKLFEQFIGEANQLKPIKISVKKSKKNPYTFSDKMDNDELHKLYKHATDMVIAIAPEEELDGYKDTDYKKAKKEIFDLMMSRGANPYRSKDTWADDWKEEDDRSKYFQVYHKHFSTVIDEVEKYVNKMGYELDKEEYDNKFVDASFKAREGEYKKDTLTLYKKGKEQRKALHVQIYGRDGWKYELNMFIK